MNKRFRNIWKRLRKFKWDYHSWYNMLIIGTGLLFLYFHSILNYVDILSIGANPDNVGKSYFYDKQLYLFDTWFGKMATIIILGILTLIPFVLAIRIYRKQRKMKQKKKIPAVEQDL